MRAYLKTAILAAIVIGSTAAWSEAAFAKCTRLAFSVNDYGKDGPTRDAKRLLDKYIAEWTAERGIKKYSTGKKTVTCDLFLDFVVFDEHTCKAEATVCWSGGESKPAKSKPSPAKSEPKKAPAKPKGGTQAKAPA